MGVGQAGGRGEGRWILRGMRQWELGLCVKTSDAPLEITGYPCLQDARCPVWRLSTRLLPAGEQVSGRAAAPVVASAPA